jgi:PAS domain S-box-containing protein
MPAQNCTTHALNQLFLPLIANAPDAVVICNATGQIILVNAQAEQWFGYAPLELHGQPLTMLLPERFRSAPLTQWAHSLVTPQGPIPRHSRDAARMARICPRNESQSAAA